MPLRTSADHGYWQAHGLAELALSRFRAAREQQRVDRQRSAFYRLARYHGRTLRVLNSGLHHQDEPLVQAALHNLQTLHRSMMVMHRASPDVVPLPLALSTHSRADFVRDLIMRVLVETPPALDVTALHARTNLLDLLGTIKEEEVRNHLDELLQAKHVKREGSGYVRTPHPYIELDKDVAGLRALIGRTFFARFAAAGFDSLGAVEDQTPGLRANFAKLTGLDDPLTAELFLETVYVLLDTSVTANRVWRHRDLLHSTDPRPYQRAAYSAFRRGDYDGLVVEAPTGSGKTLIGMLCVQDWLRTLDKGQAILILVPTSNYQQQWLDQLCYSPYGLQLAPEVVFSGTPQDYARYERLTGGRPAVLILTYSALAQLGSPVGKGGFDAQSIERFLQQGDVQHVVLDEVHKVAESLVSVTAEIIRLFGDWQRDTSLRSLIGFSGTVQGYRDRLHALDLTLCYSVPIDELVAAGYVAPFAEFGVADAYSEREREARALLDEYKAGLRSYLDLLGPERLRHWFGEIPLAERVLLGHEVLGIYRGRSDWQTALAQHMDDWATGDPTKIKLPEAQLVSMLQIARGWSDATLAEQAGVEPAAFRTLAEELNRVRRALRARIYLPKTRARLEVQGYTHELAADQLRDLPQSGLPANALRDAAKDLLATTIVGLYQGLSDWYIHAGEGRVDAVKAIVEAERAARAVSGVIVFDRGRHLDWRHGVCRPGYEGVAGLFGELQGDERFTTMAALSNEMYLTYNPADPVTDRIAGYIHRSLMDGDVAQAIFNLLLAGLDLPAEAKGELHDRFMHGVAHFTATLDDSHAARIGAFNRAVMRPLRRRVKAMALGLTGERLLARMDRRNADLKRLLQTYFDYALLATHFREAKLGEVEQSSGQRHHFHVVTMPSGARRKQLMYDLTARIVDAAEIPVNFVIVSDWARTGWNVIRPNLLIDATATRNVTAWQQLRGRALRAWPSWTNDCYRLLSVLIGHHLLSGVEVEAAEENALDRGMVEILEEIATPAQVKTLVTDGIQALPAEERQALAVRLMQERNKVTHIYELIKATGSNSQVEYDRPSGRWRRKESVAAKHQDEVSVNPFTGQKSSGPQHAPLVYVHSPRTDAPSELQQHLRRKLADCDSRIIDGWLADERATSQVGTEPGGEQSDQSLSSRPALLQEEQMPETQPSSTALAALEAAYGSPSQAAFGSAVFDQALDAGKTLETLALEKYRYFVGDLWTRYGEAAWMEPWRELYARPADVQADIVAELGAITDAGAASSASMLLDNDADALAAVFDDPAVTELRVFHIGDGEAMSGLVIAAQRVAAQEATVLVFLMD